MSTPTHRTQTQKQRISKGLFSGFADVLRNEQLKLAQDIAN